MRLVGLTRVVFTVHPEFSPLQVSVQGGRVFTGPTTKDNSDAYKMLNS
jgi:hypothetical protein